VLGKYPPCLDPTTGSSQWPLMDDGALSHGTTRATALGRIEPFADNSIPLSVIAGADD
jgi:hypothetical protein